MKVDKNWTQKKQQKISISKKKQKEVIASDVIEEKRINSPESNVSVLTKTTNPKVVINSENFKDDCNDLSYHNWKKHKLLKSICFIIICIIILMTFFLSLKTYNIVNELWYYIMQP